jgi:hypothetical protein
MRCAVVNARCQGVVVVIGGVCARVGGSVVVVGYWLEAAFQMLAPILKPITCSMTVTLVPLVLIWRMSVGLEGAGPSQNRRNCR